MRNPKLHCPLTYAVKAISGKWKLYILSMLSDGQPKRYGELKKTGENLTEKVLASQLRELEQDGIICRKVYPEVPPRVEYMLTESGRKLCAIFEPLYEWGVDYMKDNKPEKLYLLKMDRQELV